MNRGLVIGEALIDIVERRGQVTGEYVGGSPLNVAVGLARLGRDVDFLTHIGDDPRGRRIEDYVKDSGAQLVRESTTAGRTPTSRATMDDHDSASYVFDIDWQLCDTPVVPPPLMVHTGSIAAVREPGALAVAALLDTYRVSATITFDPNVRPALITDRNLVRQRIAHLVESSDVVKVSEEDLHWIDPHHTPESIAQNWLASGASIVAVTLGERGAFAVCAAGQARVAARPVQVVDTVGAGDAFMAGLIDNLWGLSLLGADRRTELGRIGLDTLTDALETAALSSAWTVAHAGADMPDRTALDSAAHSG